MKKLIALMLLAALLLPLSAVRAEDLSVKMIVPNTEYIPDSIDDMKLGTSYTLDGYATVTPDYFSIYDYFAQFGGKEDYSTFNRENWYGSIWYVASYSDSKFNFDDFRFRDAAWMESGRDAQFFWLKMDVTNRQHQEVNFIEEGSVKVIYQDEFEFIGWIRQIDTNVLSKDTTNYGVSRYGGNKEDYPNEIVLNPDKTHAIDMMYTGHYVFGCTIPNFVVEDKKSPLRMEITLGGNVLTYYIIR